MGYCSAVPRARRRDSYHHGDLANALKQAVLQLVERNGVDGFTLREAAKRVGVNHRAAYNHFADKRAVLVALALDGWEQLMATVAAELAKAGDAALDRLSAIVRGYARFAVDHPAHYRIMFGPRLNLDHAFPDLETAVARAMSMFDRELRAGIARGELHTPDPLEATLGLWGAMHGVVDMIMERRIKVRPDLTVGYVAKLVRPTLLGLRHGE
jgi:AcrR family transcriptional regulator